MCALSLHSRPSQLPDVDLLVHSPIPWRTPSCCTRHPYLCWKCRPPRACLLCLRTPSALCSVSDAGVSSPAVACCSCAFYLGTKASGPTFACVFPASSSQSFPAFLPWPIFLVPAFTASRKRMSSPCDPLALPHSSIRFSFFFFSFCNLLFSSSSGSAEGNVSPCLLFSLFLS